MFRTTSVSASGAEQGIHQYIPPDLRRMFYKNPAAIHASHNGLDPYGFSTRGLVLYLPLWALKDSAFQSVDAYRTAATVSGAAWGTTGRTFDKIDNIITLSASTALNNLRASTYIAWINPTSKGENDAAIVMDKETSAIAIAGWHLRLIGANTIRFQHSAAILNLFRDTDADAITLGSAQMVATTFDGLLLKDGIKHYVNGSETGYGASADAGGALEDDAAKPVRIGNDSATAYTFEGLIGELWIYNQVLSAGEILHNYNCTNWRYQ